MHCVAEVSDNTSNSARHVAGAIGRYAEQTNCPNRAHDVEERRNHLVHDLTGVPIKHKKGCRMHIHNVVEGWQEDSEAQIQI